MDGQLLWMQSEEQMGAKCACFPSLSEEHGIRASEVTKVSINQRDQRNTPRLRAVSALPTADVGADAVCCDAAGQILVLLLSVDQFKAAKSAAHLARLEDCVVMAFLIPDKPILEEDRKHVLQKQVPLKTLYNALSDLCETR